MQLVDSSKWAYTSKELLSFNLKWKFIYIMNVIYPFQALQPSDFKASPPFFMSVIFLFGKCMRHFLKDVRVSRLLWKSKCVVLKTQKVFCGV